MRHMPQSGWFMFMEKKKTALITGASRGIGKATAETFARAGYDLVLTCVSSILMLTEFGKHLEGEYDINCKAFQVDVGSYEEVKELFAEIPEVDVLVNNAGIAYIGLLSDMEPEDWRKIMGTNLDGCFHTCKFAVPDMVRRHEGRIINVSSVWGSLGASMEVAYSASKGGLNAFTKALARELAPSNIQVNAVSCGVIDTDMNRGFSAEDMDSLRAEIPADRLGTPEEVAELILQTAQAPAYMTGQIITIDGGWC